MSMRAGTDLFSIYGVLYEKFGPQGWWPGDSDFEMIVGAILTQNTAWKNVERAIANLKKAAVLSLRKLDELSIKTLTKLIRPAGYFNVKAARLKTFTQWLKKVSRGNIQKLKSVPLSKLRTDLLNVHGIGPETADSILLYALEKKTFVVDTYTKRIFSRHGFFSEKSEYHNVKNLFEKSLPRSQKIYNEFHALIVKIGKDFCRKKPLCFKCPLEEDLIKFRTNGRPVTGGC